MNTLSLLVLALVFPASVSAATLQKSLIVKPSLRALPAQTSATKRTKAEFQRSSAAIKKLAYTSLDNPFRFSYPSDWETYDFPQGRGVKISPAYDGFTQKSGRRSAIDIDRFPGQKMKEMTSAQLDTYFTNRTNLSATPTIGDWYIPSFSLISSEDAVLLGKPARKYTYTGEMGSEKYKVVENLTVIDSVLYKAIYYVDPAYFDADLPVFNHVVDSLKLGKSGASSSRSSRNHR